MDLSVSKTVLQTKYNKFLELQKDLQRCEPRVVSLQEAADQLELQADSPACKQVKKKLAVLSRSLRSLIQVCGIYLTSLARTLGLPPPPQVSESLYDSALNIHDTVLPSLTDQVNFRIFFQPPIDLEFLKEFKFVHKEIEHSYMYCTHFKRDAPFIFIFS